MLTSSFTYTFKTRLIDSIGSLSVIDYNIILYVHEFYSLYNGLYYFVLLSSQVVK